MTLLFPTATLWETNPINENTSVAPSGTESEYYHPCQWPYPPQFPEPRRSHPESDRHSGQQLFLSLSYPQWDEKITHLREVNGRVHAPCLSMRRVQSFPKTEESTF